MKRTSLILLCVFWAGGCVVYKDSVKSQAQDIRVTSEPEGATIAVSNQDGSQLLGKTPLTFTATYTLVDREYNKGSCALSGSAAMADAMSDGDGINSDAEAAAGLIGMVLGAAVGAASCAEADGIVAIQPKRMAVQASLAGHYLQKVAVEIPKDRPIIHFQMVPDPNLPTPSTPVADDSEPVDTQPEEMGPVARITPPKPNLTRLTSDTASQLGRVAVFDLQVTWENAPQTQLSVLSAYLATTIRETAEVEVVFPAELEMCGDVDCRIKSAQAASARHFLDTRIFKKGELCLTSASLFDMQTKRQRLVAASQSACNMEALMATMDKVVELLINPPDPETPPEGPPEPESQE